MYRRFAKWLVVLALIFTVGGHWAILQTVAWVGMAVNYSHNEGFSTALNKILDGKHPCELCKFVKEGKKSEHKSETQLDLKKIDFFALNASEIYFPSLQQNPFCFISLLLPRREAPPTPPPNLA